MKLRMDTKTLLKAIKTLQGVNKYAKISYLGEEGISIISVSPNFSFCEINIKQGWGGKDVLEGDPEESIIVDLEEVLRSISGSSDVSSLESTKDSETVSITSGDSKTEIKKESRSIEPNIYPKDGLKFRMSGDRFRHILKIIEKIDDRVSISVGSDTVNFSASEVGEAYTASQKIEVEVGSPFVVGYYVEPLVDAIGHMKISREEEIEVQLGSESPIGLVFRLRENIFVRYVQVSVKTTVTYLS